VGPGGCATPPFGTEIRGKEDRDRIHKTFTTRQVVMRPAMLRLAKTPLGEGEQKGGLGQGGKDSCASSQSNLQKREGRLILRISSPKQRGPLILKILPKKENVGYGERITSATCQMKFGLRHVKEDVPKDA